MAIGEFSNLEFRDEYVPAPFGKGGGWNSNRRDAENEKVTTTRTISLAASLRRSGDVTVAGNHGRWTPAAEYLRVPGSDGLVGIVPNLPWDNVVARKNRRAR